jgi:hypothetical protein
MQPKLYSRIAERGLTCLQRLHIPNFVLISDGSPLANDGTDTLNVSATIFAQVIVEKSQGFRWLTTAAAPKRLASLWSWGRGLFESSELKYPSSLIRKYGKTLIRVKKRT